jgi:hypothetical protein
MAGVAVVWLVMRPRRQPHLERVPRSAAFRTDRAAAAAWVEGQFRLILSRGPLARARGHDGEGRMRAEP